MGAHGWQWYLPPGTSVTIVQGPPEDHRHVLDRDINGLGFHQLHLAAGNGQVVDLDAVRANGKKGVKGLEERRAIHAPSCMARACPAIHVPTEKHPPQNGPTRKTKEQDSTQPSEHETGKMATQLPTSVPAELVIVLLTAKGCRWCKDLQGQGTESPPKDLGRPSSNTKGPEVEGWGAEWPGEEIRELQLEGSLVGLEDKKGGHRPQSNLWAALRYSRSLLGTSRRKAAQLMP